MKMKDPLVHLYNKFGYHRKAIDSFIEGETYFAIINADGNIGLAAMLGRRKISNHLDLKAPDFSDIEQRILLTAYYNSMLNYSNEYNKKVDIFDELEFKHYRNIVMVGLCRPLFKKMNDQNIPVHVFDDGKEDDVLISMEEQSLYLKSADCVIVTSTAVINGTIGNILENLNPSCDVYLFGPSGILSEEMFNFRNVKYVFGSVFDKNDERVLDLIDKGQGTPSFSKFMHKVFIKNPNQ